jgi:hypothetical protein
MMKKKILAVVVASALCGAGSLAMASPGGAHAHTGGKSSAYISDEGLLNTNGPNALDRDKGLERAEDRMSQSGLTHEKATLPHHKHKQHRRPS